MDLCTMRAVDLSAMIKEKKIKVTDLLDACFDGIRQKEETINAFITVCEEQAYREAEVIQKKIDAGQLDSPLAGIPIAVKDNICTKGVRTTCGSKMLENFVPTYDAAVSEKIKEAGMIILGKTNMDEFAMGSTTETSYFGPTKNPVNIKHVPGGSSGGSAAAVAAGEAILALGSDTGGSIRQPASFCAVSGLKPTYGCVSRYGLVAYGSSLDQIGPVARNVADCAALLDVIEGPDKRDSTSVDLSLMALQNERKTDLKQLKIGLPREYFGEGLQKEVSEAVLFAAEVLKEKGAQVEWFDARLIEYAVPAYYVIASAEASSNLERFDGVKYGFRAKQYKDLHDMYKATRSEGFGTEVKRRIMLGSFVLSSGYYDAYYLKALRVKNLISRSFDEAFAKYDLILSPTAPTTAPKLGESLKDPIAMYLSDIYTVSVNLAGLPAMSVPFGCDQNGLPIGVQLIGAAASEKTILHAAGILEQGFLEAKK